MQKCNKGGASLRMKEEGITSTFLYWDYLESILEHVQDGIYITDNEANTVYINHSYELISGLVKTDMLGKNMRDLVENGVISASGTLMVLETGESVTIEQGFKTGKRAIITSAPIFEDPLKQSHIIMIVTIVREITELYSVRKELQRLEQQNRQYVRALERLNSEMNENVEMVAVDDASMKLMHLMERVSIVDNPVLISGEAGVGKEKAAQFIHNHSKRSGFLYMRINFSVVPKDDPVKYLFGYEDSEKGDYHMGILESAEGGTVYLDEITEMPQEVRGRFLALLRDGACVLGDGMLHKLDIRFIVGSKYSLEELQKRSLIESDILEHFSLFPIEILPLRERRDDIIPLLEHFLRQFERKTGEKKFFSRECYEKLFAYEWPGNVREAYVLVQRAAIVSTKEEISLKDVMINIENGQEYMQAPPDANIEAALDGDGVDLKYEVAKLEAQYMAQAFAKYKNIRIAAEKLGMDSSTFVRKRQRYEKMGLMDKNRKKSETK